MPNATLDMLLEKYCSIMHLPRSETRFLLDGIRVDGLETTGQLKREMDASYGPGQEIMIEVNAMLDGGGLDKVAGSTLGKRTGQEITGAAGDFRVTFDMENNMTVGMSVSKKLKTFECKMNMTECGKVSFAWSGQMTKQNIGGEETVSDLPTQKVVGNSGENLDTVNCKTVSTSGKDGSAGPKLKQPDEKVRLRFYHLGESILMTEDGRKKLGEVMDAYSQKRKVHKNNFRFFSAGDRLDCQRNVTIAELKDNFAEYLNTEGEVEIDVAGEVFGGGPQASPGQDGGKVVELVFKMPDGTEAPLKVSTKKTMEEACKMLCLRKNLDFDTTRFLQKGAFVIWIMLVAKVWKIANEAGDARIIISVLTGCAPYKYVSVVAEPQLETVPKEKLNLYPADATVTFEFKLANYKDFIIRARMNQTMGTLFRFYSRQMTGQSNIVYRFLLDGDRVSNYAELIGELHDRYEYSEGSHAIELEVHPELDGGQPSSVSR